MGKSKKQFKRFESAAYIMLELLDKAVEMKKLQLDELKMKREIRGEEVRSIPKMRPMTLGNSVLNSVNNASTSLVEKYPIGGVIVGMNQDFSEFANPKFGTIDCDCPQCQSRKNAERKAND